MNKPLKGNYRISQDWDAFSYRYPFWGFRHKGIDWAAPIGTSIYLSEKSKIVTAKYSGSWGNLVVADGLETGYQLWFAHLNKIYVGTGQLYNRDTVLGTVDSTGLSTGNHLHFGVKINGQWVNPHTYLAIKKNDMSDAQDKMKKAINDKASKPNMGYVYITGPKGSYGIGRYAKGLYFFDGEYMRDVDKRTKKLFKKNPTMFSAFALWASDKTANWIKHLPFKK